MASTHPDFDGEISHRWKTAAGFTMIFGFAILILLTVKAYQNAPPIPGRVVDPAGNVVYTDTDVAMGQQMFLKHALMDNGTIWGHGGYLGPDFSAQYLHEWATDVADVDAQRRFERRYAALSSEERATIDGGVAGRMRQNRYDPERDVLQVAAVDAASFYRQVGLWTDYFKDPAKNGGLKKESITDPQELRTLTAFFAWAAWASVAQRPGAGHSYTSNFPYDPLVGNRPTPGTVIYSAISFIFLLTGTALVLFAFGRFDFLGWHVREDAPTHTPALVVSDAQRATLKFMAVAAVLFVVQTLVGGAVAHYRSEPGSFYGFDLSTILPSNLLRTWHLQLAIFWVATAYIAGALFVAEMIGGTHPRGQRGLIHVLFAAATIVAIGSLLGEWAGQLGWLGALWFWLGNQGWEYLEIGRFWQILLALGFGFWFWLLWRQLAPARRDPQRRALANLFLIAAAAIPVFYVPALFFGSTTHYTIVDTWRFWIIHLWVEGFFELFITVIVAVVFYHLGLAARSTALRAIYLDVILVFGGGLVGTGHHWYFTGQSELNMALASSFSALEVVPLTLLTLDAWGFVKLTRPAGGAPFRHKWAARFLLAVGFWNFTGAGVFGFLINTPIVSYFEMGTNLTPNHGHAAMMGVFGMLAVALMVFVLREVVEEASWRKLETYVACAFWGLNIGLAMMVVFSLLPSGVLQVADVLENGYWHARSLAYTAGRWPRLLEWLRLPGDVVFIVAGALPIAIAIAMGYRTLWSSRRPLGVTQSASTK